MRATSMRRLLGRAGAVLLLMGLALGVNAPAYAAVPLATVHDDAIPTQYSAGNNVGYRSTYTYSDGSTLSKLYLVLNTTGTTANTYLSATRNGANATNNCTAGIPVTCVFKTVRTNEVIVVTAAFTPGDGATPTADPLWSSSGSTTSDGGTSHGDTWTDPAVTQTPLTTDPTNYGGGFSVTAGGGVANGQAVSAVNKQATKLLGLPAGVAATVLDGTATSADCGPIDCSTAFGEWSEVTVGDGQAFGSAFQIVITYYQGSPKGFVHRYGSAPDYQYEPVGACPKKNPAAAAPCFTWTASTRQATIYTLHNGSWKGL